MSSFSEEGRSRQPRRETRPFQHPSLALPATFRASGVWDALCARTSPPVHDRRPSRSSTPCFPLLRRASSPALETSYSNVLQPRCRSPLTGDRDRKWLKEEKLPPFYRHPPTLSLGINLSSDPYFKNTFPATKSQLYKLLGKLEGDAAGSGQLSKAHTC